MLIPIGRSEASEPPPPPPCLTTLCPVPLPGTRGKPASPSSPIRSQNSHSVHGSPVSSRLNWTRVSILPGLGWPFQTHSIPNGWNRTSLISSAKQPGKPSDEKRTSCTRWLRRCMRLALAMRRRRTLRPRFQGVRSLRSLPHPCCHRMTYPCRCMAHPHLRGGTAHPHPRGGMVHPYP